MAIKQFYSKLMISSLETFAFQADVRREQKRAKSKTIIFNPLWILSYTNLPLPCPTLGNYIPCWHKKILKVGWDYWILYKFEKTNKVFSFKVFIRAEGDWVIVSQWDSESTKLFKQITNNSLCIIGGVAPQSAHNIKNLSQNLNIYNLNI